MNKDCIVSAEDLREFGKGVFVKAGVSEQHARETAEILVDANLRGVDTHGIYLSNVYARRLKLGLLNPKPQFKFERKRAGVGVLDADFSLGQPATLEATRKAIELARDAGVGVVSVKNSNHFGAAAYYGEYCAGSGCIGLIMGDAECDVIPYGGKDKFCGTNPLCCCVPAKNQPWFCVDMATSQAAFGKVRAAAEAGKSIPPNWAVDRDGNPVTDPTKAYAVVPVGGVKGYCLGLMMEIFSSRLSGMPYGLHIVRKFDDWEHQVLYGALYSGHRHIRLPSPGRIPGSDGRTDRGTQEPAHGGRIRGNPGPGRAGTEDQGPAAGRGNPGAGRGHGTASRSGQGF